MLMNQWKCRPALQQWARAIRRGYDRDVAMVISVRVWKIGAAARIPPLASGGQQRILYTEPK